MSNLIRINNKLMTKNNKLLTANLGSSGLAYNNNLLKFNNYVISSGSAPVPPGPVLPSNTVRVKTSDGQPPIKDKAAPASYETATLVAGTSDVYDVYKSGTNFFGLLASSINVIEVLGANTTGITNMQYMFYGCSSLTSVPLFDTSSVTTMQSMFNNCSSLTTVPLLNTSSVTDMQAMFYYCSSLTTVPLFDTSSVTNMNTMFHSCSSLIVIPLFNTSSVTSMNNMFRNCSNVESGALALYNQASSQTTPPSNHSYTFRNCGSNTVTGAAELAQIPSSWGGTGT